MTPRPRTAAKRPKPKRRAGKVTRWRVRSGDLNRVAEGHTALDACVVALQDNALARKTKNSLGALMEVRELATGMLWYCDSVECCKCAGLWASELPS